MSKFEEYREINMHRFYLNGKKHFGYFNEKAGWIELSKGQIAIVDAKDMPALLEYTWYAQLRNTDGNFYAARRAENYGTIIYMHQDLLEMREGLVPDHINLNSLDNRRENLRMVTRGVNAQNKKTVSNKSGFRGVYESVSNGKWFSAIQKDGVPYHLGTFDDVTDAINAYDEKAVELYGPHAMTNTRMGLI